MVRSCCVFGCTVKFGGKDESLTFHKFPRNPARCELWEKNIPPKIFKATKHASICSKHFTADSFDTNKTGGTWLKDDAVPTLFDSPVKVESKTPEIKKEIPINQADNELVQENNFLTPNRKKYIGDYKEEDMKSPTNAKALLLMATERFKNKNKVIKDLRQRERRLQQKLGKYKEILNELKLSPNISKRSKKILDVQVTPEELSKKYKKKLPESQTNKISPKLKLPIPRSAAAYLPSSTQSVQPGTLTNTTTTFDLQTPSISGIQPFTFGTPAALGPILLSMAPSGSECVSPDSVPPDVKPPPELLASAENVTSSNWSDSTCSESQIIIKQEIIEIEEAEDVLDSLFLQSSASCSRDSFIKVQDSERFSPSVLNPVSSEESISFSCQKEAKRPRLSSPLACLSKEDIPKNSHVTEVKHHKDHFDEFGVFVASKLRNLDRKLCSSVQKAIADLLFEAETGIFLTLQEKATLEEKSHLIINELHATVAEKSLFLQSPASCSRDYVVHEGSERLSPLVKKPVTSDKNESKLQIQKRTKRSRPNSPVTCSSKYGFSENSDEPEANQPKDQFFAFGMFVASKMRKLDCKSCAFVQNAITDLLFDPESGLFKTLQETSSFEENSKIPRDSIIKKRLDLVSDTSTAELSS